MQKATKVGRIKMGAKRRRGRWAILTFASLFLLAKTISLSFTGIVLSRPKALNPGSGPLPNSDCSVMKMGAGSLPAPILALCIQICSDQRSAVDSGVLDGPAVNISLLNSGPVGVGGIGGVSGQSGDQSGAEGVNIGSVVESPGDGVVAVGSPLHHTQK